MHITLVCIRQEDVNTFVATARADQDQIGQAFFRPLSKMSLLQNSHCRGDFSRLEATAEDAGGHFWHDAVIETNIITPAQWILPNRNRSCNGGT